MKNLKRWERADNYAGSNFFEYFVGLGQHRDSDILEQSNFACALIMLGGESETVIVEHAGHWVVGWVETILVHESDKPRLKILSSIREKLDDYPVLDESDYSEREYEYQSEYAQGAQEDLAKAISKHFRIRNSKYLAEISYLLNMEQQGYAGNDSCINIHTGRAPDDRDVKELRRALERISHNIGKKQKPIYDRLVKKVSAWKAAA